MGILGLRGAIFRVSQAFVDSRDRGVYLGNLNRVDLINSFPSLNRTVEKVRTRQPKSSFFSAQTRSVDKLIS